MHSHHPSERTVTVPEGKQARIENTLLPIEVLNERAEFSEPCCGERRSVRTRFQGLQSRRLPELLGCPQVAVWRTTVERLGREDLPLEMLL